MWCYLHRLELISIGLIRHALHVTDSLSKGQLESSMPASKGGAYTLQISIL